MVVRPLGTYPKRIDGYGMPGIQKLKAPILLKSGRRLDSPHEAAGLIAALSEPQQAKEHWKQAAALLTAAGKGKPVDLAAVQRQLERALKEDGLI